MAVTVFNSTATLAEVSTGTSITVNVPASVAAGDLLVLSASVASATIAGTLSGWTTAATTNIDSAASIGCYYRVATASEPASYTLTSVSGASGRISASILRLSGVNSTPLDDAQTAVNSGGGSVTAAQVTTTVAGDAIVYTVGADAASASDFTVPTGTTLIKDSTGTGKRMVTAFETQSGTGLSAARTFPETGTVISDGAITVAFKAASGSTTGSGTFAGSGSGTLAVTGAPKPTGSAAFSGSGTLAVTGTPKPATTVALSGSGALSAQPGARLLLGGSGTLAVTVRAVAVTAGVTLGGAGTFTAGTPNLALFSGVGALAVTGTPSVSVAAAFGSDGGLAVTAAQKALYHFPGPLVVEYRPLERIYPQLLNVSNTYAQTVWRDASGQWHAKHAPGGSAVAGATRLYPGGYLNPLDDAQRAELITAGFGDWITLENVP